MGAAALVLPVALVLAGVASPSTARLIRVETGQSAQAAVAQAAAGDTVELGAGSFSGPLALTRGVCVRGQGEGRTVLTNPGGEVVHVHSGTRGAVVSELTVRRARTGIVIDDARVRLVGCWIENCDDFGLTSRDSSIVELERCFLRNNRVGIVAREGTNLIVAGCEIRGSNNGLDLDGAVTRVIRSEVTGNQVGFVIRGTGRLVLGDQPGAGNRIHRNRLGTVKNLTPRPVAARYNYWGDVTCAFVRGFSGPVAYLPFMNIALDDTLAACP